MDWETDSQLKEEKLEKLAEDFGMSVDELLEHGVFDSVVPGICMNDDCDYSTEYEPDQREGWCAFCHVGSVASAFVLADIH